MNCTPDTDGKVALSVVIVGDQPCLSTISDDNGVLLQLEIPSANLPCESGPLIGVSMRQMKGPLVLTASAGNAVATIKTGRPYSSTSEYFDRLFHSELIRIATEGPQMTPEERMREALSDAFCSNGQCGGDKSSAPCERVRMLASTAMAVIKEPSNWVRIEPTDLERAARSEALEEAAKVVDGWGQDENFGGHGMVYAPLATAIRDLKDKP